MIPLKIKALATATCLSLAAASSANALVLSIDDLGVGAGSEVVLTDAVVPGLINFAGSVGVFDLVVSTGFGAPILGGPGEAEIDLSVQSSSDVNGVLQVSLEDTGLSLGSGFSGLTETILSDLGVNALNNASATVESFIRIGASLVYEGLASTTDVDLLQTHARDIGDNETFDLMTVITVTHGDNGAFSSADANIKVSAVPVPAALPFLLTGLLGLGFVGRSRRKDA